MLATRPRVVKCRACERETSVTAGTILHGTKTSLLVWFWAVFLVATQTPGISALELQKKLGIPRYETAFQLLHKLCAAMVRPDLDPIGAEWPTEMDISFVGGKHKGGGSGKTHKLPVIIAVERRRNEKRDPETGKIVERAPAPAPRHARQPGSHGCVAAHGQYRHRQSQDLARRDLPWRPSAAPSGIPQRIHVPLPPTPSIAPSRSGRCSDSVPSTSGPPTAASTMATGSIATPRAQTLVVGRPDRQGVLSCFPSRVYFLGSPVEISMDLPARPQLILGLSLVASPQPARAIA